MARKKRKGPPLLHRASNKLFPVFPVLDQGIKIEKEKIGWYLFAERNPNLRVDPYRKDTPYIAQITGLDPTYRYSRQFLSDRNRSVYGRAAHLFRAVDKPMLLNIRAWESDYYLLRTDDKDIKLERISRDTVDELLEADAIGKMPSPFTPARQGYLPDTPDIRDAVQNMNTATIAFNSSLERLNALFTRGAIHNVEYEDARRALEQWYHRVQQERLPVIENPPPSISREERRPGRVMGPGVRGDERLTGQEERISYTSLEEALAVVANRESSFTVQDAANLFAADYPSARKKKPKDFEKQGYKAPILIAGKRRINLKDLKD